MLVPTMSTTCKYRFGWFADRCQDIAVTVTNTNEAPVITSNGGGATAASRRQKTRQQSQQSTSDDVDARPQLPIRSRVVRMLRSSRLSFDRCSDLCCRTETLKAPQMPVPTMSMTCKSRLGWLTDRRSGHRGHGDQHQRSPRHHSNGAEQRRQSQLQKTRQQ